MGMPTTSPARERPPLTRERICAAGLAFVDEHGLEALSLHKLGAELGVRAMSLYNHIGGKDDLLNGIAECLWREVEGPHSRKASWRAALERSARGIREVILRHPAASALLVTRTVFPLPALRAAESLVSTLRATGFSERRAVDVVRLLISYAIGSTLSEVCWASCGAIPPGGGAEPVPNVALALPSGTPEPLLDLAVKICGECDPAQMFDLGLELMLRGLEPDEA